MLERFGLKPYEDPAVEAAFQEHYFQHGQRLVLVLCFLVVFLAGSTFLRDIFLANPDTYVAGKQVLRLAVCAASICIFIILYRSKDLSIANFKLLQLVLAGVVVSACFLLFFFLAEPYTDEAFARNNSTITIALIAVCTLLRLPLSLLFCVMALLFFGMAYATWGFFQTNPRVWIQGQIFLFSGFMLGFLTHTTNRWNERRLFELQRKLDAQLNIEAENNLKKTKFIAALSHDLRQPLTGLIGYLELAETQVPKNNDNKLANYLKRAQNSANAINTNLTRVLELARLQDVGSSINIKAIDLIELLNLIGRLFEAQLATHSITLKIIKPQSDHILVETDFDLLFQVIQNLVANAIKHRRGEPIKAMVILSIVQLLNGKTKISIVDNGTGIPRNEFQNIFKPYYQINNPERQIAKGLGLGLAFVHEAIQRLPKHEIQVWSNEKSLTKFNLLLPSVSASEVKKTDGAILTARPRPKAQLDQLSSLRVLVIEDDAGVREFVAEVLHSFVNTVYVAPNVNDISQLISMASSCNFIVCDYDLPGELKGYAVTSRLRESCCKQIPALIISGRSELKPPLGFAQTAFLQKPFDATQLLDIIGNLGSQTIPLKETKRSIAKTHQTKK
jgi:signal transduction histidine kinase